MDEIKLRQLGEKEHKTVLTSFEMKCPRQIQNIKLEVKDSVEIGELAYWVKYDWEDFKEHKALLKAYQDMEWNFGRETNQFDMKEGFSEIWILFMSTLKKGLKLTGEYYPVGMLGCGRPEINFNLLSLYIAWIHPYARSHGCMRQLLTHIGKQEMYALEPPVTDRMSVCAGSIQHDPETMKMWIKGNKEYFSKRWNYDVTGLDDQTFILVRETYQILPENERDGMIKELIEMFSDPKVIEKLRNMDISGMDPKSIMKRKNQMQNKRLVIDAMEKD